MSNNTIRPIRRVIEITHEVINEGYRTNNQFVRVRVFLQPVNNGFDLLTRVEYVVYRIPNFPPIQKNNVQQNFEFYFNTPRDLLMEIHVYLNNLDPQRFEYQITLNYPNREEIIFYD